jgi:sugar O-acyltransferase (sialic acid O-acetyltransferase NeuD family)
MKKKIFSIYGYGGHAREVASQMQQFIKKNGFDLEFYVDDQYANNYAKPISKFNPEKGSMMVAVADPLIREKMIKNLSKETNFFSFIHPTALVLDNDNINIGEGSFIGAFSVITTNVNIGKHSILNRANHIGHDTIIDDFLSMMPGSIISGNVKAGKRLYIGTNSSIREKLNICDDVIIGLNSGVIKSIVNPGIYIGNPAKYKI